MENKKKPLADTTYNELVREQWGIFHKLPMAFTEPRRFLQEEARGVGMFLLFVSVLTLAVIVINDEIRTVLDGFIVFRMPED